MSKPCRWTPLAVVIVAGSLGCGADAEQVRSTAASTTTADSSVAAKVAQYTPVRLNADL